MSGLYLLFVLGIWCGLTWLLLKLIPSVLASRLSYRGLRIILVSAVLLAWFGVSFWYGGGRKVYYDAEVNRLCAIDGGVKVYEAVKLAPENFDKYGQINFYNPTQKENALGTDYVFKWNLHYIRTGDPSLHRSHRLVLRRADSKVLGESIGYSRGGGDLPGPWQPSSFSCPAEYGDTLLLEKIFVQSIKE